MNLAAFLVSLVAGVAQLEGPKLLAFVESKLPGSVTAFANFVKGLPIVQSWVATNVAKAEADATAFLNGGLAKLEQEAAAHIHGALGDFIAQHLAQLGALTFTAQEVADLSILLAAGKLDGAIAAAKADLAKAAA